MLLFLCWWLLCLEDYYQTPNLFAEENIKYQTGEESVTNLHELKVCLVTLKKIKQFGMIDNA